MSLDLYQLITDRIIAALESGTIPWHKAWACTNGAISRYTGKPYSVLNQMLLPQAGEYVTFRQAVEEGHTVKKGGLFRKIAVCIFLTWSYIFRLIRLILYTYRMTGT